MRTLKKFITGVLLFSMLLLSANITVFAEKDDVMVYISPDGNDSGSGDYSSPLLTLAAAKNKLKSMSSSSGNKCVVLKGGEYFWENTVSLTGDDSGTETQKFVIKGADGEKAVIHHSKSISSSLFEKVNDQKLLERIISEEARDKIYSLDLKKLGMESYGHAWKHEWASFCETDFELFSDGEFCDLARYPNVGSTDIIVSGNVDTAPSAGAATFDVDTDRVAKWTQAKDALVHGNFARPWANDSLGVLKFDGEKSLLYVDRIPALGLNSDTPFFIYNLIEELDQNGEYYIDRTKGMLYVYCDKDINNAKFEYSTNKNTYFTIKDAKNISIENLYLNYGLGIGIEIENSENITIKNCNISHLNGEALIMKKANNSSVYGCEISQLLNNAIKADAGDNTNLIRGNLRIENNHIHHWALRAKMYSSAIELVGSGNTVANNSIHDAPHMALSFKGTYHTIENNEFYNLLTETNDAGVIYVGRNWTERGSVIRNNFFHHIVGAGAACYCVYFDDTYSAAEANDNIFYKTTAPVLIGGGSDNTFKNNLISERTETSPGSITGDARNSGSWLELLPTLEMNLTNSPYKTEIWQKAFPTLANIDNEDPLLPKRNVITDNIISRHARINLGEIMIENGTFENNYVTQEKIRISVGEWGNPIIKNPEILEKFPTYKLPDISKIGLLGDGIYEKPVREYAKTKSTVLPKNIQFEAETLDMAAMLKDKNAWKFEGGAITPSDDGITISKGTLAYTARPLGNVRLLGRVEFPKDYTPGYYLGIMLRASMDNGAPWGNQGYLIIIKDDFVEFHRYSGKSGMLRDIENKFKTEKPLNFEFITSTDDNDKVVVQFRLNGMNLINYYDNTKNAYLEPGNILFYNSDPDHSLKIVPYDYNYVSDENPYTELMADDENMYDDDDENGDIPSKPESSISEFKKGIYKMQLNDEVIDFDVEPQLIENRLYVPLRAIFEKFGAEFDFDPESSQTAVKTDSVSVRLTNQSSEAYIDGQPYKLSAPCLSLGGRTLVPSEFIARSLGLKVKWDGKTNTIKFEK